MANIQLKDYFRDTGLVQSRLIVAAVVVVVLSLALLVRLYYLQVVQHEHYATLSLDNRIRYVPIPPVRGQIYDRNGVLLAENLPVYTLRVTPDKVKNMEELITRIQQWVGLDDDDLERFRSTLKTRPGFETQILKSGLADDEVARFAVNQHRVNGVELAAELQRHYPLGAETVHVVGYVGRISEKDLERIDRSVYRGTDYIGKLGIEAHYEKDLLGKPGLKRVETNAHGRVVRTIGSITPPVSGSDLHLSIEVGLQRAAREYLGEHTGAVVAIEPATGAVLAMVSNPVYDPNPFVNGIDSKSYQALRKSPSRPLLNRALHGRYAPGSTIKGVFGLASLQYGNGPGRTVSCPGWYSLKGSRHRYRCWKRAGHGPMDLHDAITQSCDVYFYTLAHQLGIDRIHSFLTGFGFGAQTQIDLDDEPSGLVPSTQWKRRVRGQPWWPGETVIHGIGQGYTLVTPLQLASTTATLAMRGRKLAPQLVQTTFHPSSGYVRKESISVEPVRLKNRRYYDTVFRALTDVVHGQRGTARRSGLNAKYRFAGKTGTAQVIGIPQGGRYDEKRLAKRFHDHSLFIAFAPVEDPQIAVAVIAENGGSGSRTAAPIARKVLDYYLLRPPVDDKDENAPG
jgi:penicillin-binding protein 2